MSKSSFLPALWPALLLLSACGQEPAPTGSATPQDRALPQAGKPMDPSDTAASLAAIQTAALTGDEEAVRRKFREMHSGLMRSMKIPDPRRKIDRESARAAARQVAGVRSVVWLDRENLLALVESADARSYSTIDEICYELEALGDPLAVVVNLQNANARNGDELEILSRNCQLAPGDRAFARRERMVDVIDPAIRAQHEANQELFREQAARKAEDDAANEAALLAIPEM